MEVINFSLIHLSSLFTFKKIFILCVTLFMQSFTLLGSLISLRLWLVQYSLPIPEYFASFAMNHNSEEFGLNGLQCHIIWMKSDVLEEHLRLHDQRISKARSRQEITVFAVCFFLCLPCDSVAGGNVFLSGGRLFLKCMNPKDGTLCSHHSDNLKVLALLYVNLTVQYSVFFLAGTMSWS